MPQKNTACVPVHPSYSRDAQKSKQASIDCSSGTQRPELCCWISSEDIPQWVHDHLTEQIRDAGSSCLRAELSPGWGEYTDASLLRRGMPSVPDCGSHSWVTCPRVTKGLTLFPGLHHSSASLSFGAFRIHCLDSRQVRYGRGIIWKYNYSKGKRRKKSHGQCRQSQGDLQPSRHGQWGQHRDTEQTKCTQCPCSHTASRMAMCGQCSAWVGLCVSGLVCTTGNETGKHN